MAVILRTRIDIRQSYRRCLGTSINIGQVQTTVGCLFVVVLRKSPTHLA